MNIQRVRSDLVATERVTVAEEPELVGGAKRR